MKNWLLILLLPFGMKAQISPENLSTVAIEILDTATLNTIDPRSLWQVFNLSKDEIYALDSYRSAFGGIVHPSEVYFIDGLDSSTADYLLELFPLKKQRQRRKVQLILKASQSASGWRTAQSVLLRETHNSGAFHQTVTNGATQRSAFLQTKLQGTSLILGDFTMHAGQGLLFGRAGFPSATTNEYFTRGLKGRTGSSSAGVLHGTAVYRKIKNWHCAFAVDTANTLAMNVHYATNNGNIFGLAGTPKEQSVYFTFIKGPFRGYGEATTKAQRIGMNIFANDVIFESNLYRDTNNLGLEMYLNGRTSLGKYRLIFKDRKLRAQWHHEKFQLFLSEHLTEEVQHPSTWRIRVLFPASGLNYAVHVHGKTKGCSAGNTAEIGHIKLKWTGALIDYGGNPVWLGTPVARGYIGASGIYEDFVGCATAVSWKNIGWSATFNAINPAASRFQMSWYAQL